MRVVLGPPPDDPGFLPEQAGWRLVRTPGYGSLIVFGTVVGALVGAAIGFGWSQVPGRSPGLRIDFAAFGVQVGAVGATGFILGVGLVFLALLVGMHELLHALAFPGFGLSRATVLGFWPSRFLPYADHQGPLPCWRYVVGALAPLGLLSITPLAVVLATGSSSTWWMLVSVINALASGGDVVIVAMVLAQVPKGAALRNKGWDTWWQPPEGASGAPRGPA